MEVFNSEELSDHFSIFAKQPNLKQRQKQSRQLIVEESDLISTPSSTSTIKLLEYENGNNNNTVKKSKIVHSEDKRIKLCFSQTTVTKRSRKIISKDNKKKKTSKNNKNSPVITLKKHLSSLSSQQQASSNNTVTIVTSAAEAPLIEIQQAAVTVAANQPIVSLTTSTNLSPTFCTQTLITTKTEHQKRLESIRTQQENEVFLAEKNSLRKQNQQLHTTEKQVSIEQRHRSIDEEIRYRYQQYFQLELELRDQYKTDYTYAHSYSYSPLVPAREQYNWIVPNMSRPSVRYRAGSSPSKTGFIEENIIRRRFVENVPMSQIITDKKTTTSYQTTVCSNKTTKDDKHFIKRNEIFLDEQPFHSTPFKSLMASKASSSIHHKSSNLEFSDDDDEDEPSELNQTVRHTPTINLASNTIGSRPAKKTGTTTVTKTVTYPGGTDDQYGSGQYSEEDYDDGDDDEWTIIRQIQRFCITTIRYLPFIRSSNREYDTNAIENDNQNDNSHVPLVSSTSNHHHLNPPYSNIYQQTHRTSTLKNKILTTGSYGLSWFSLSGVKTGFHKDDEDPTSRSWILRRRVWLFLLLFILLFLLPLLLSYLFGNSDSSYYHNLLNFNSDDSSQSPPISPPTQSSSTLIASILSRLSPFFSWPKLLSFESLPQWSFPMSFPYPFAVISSHNQELSNINEEIIALKQELLSIKNSNQESLPTRNSVLPLSPPDIDGLLHRIKALESKLITCCQASTVNTSSISWIDKIIELEKHVRLLVDTKMFDMQQRYDLQLKHEIDNVKSNLIRFFEKHQTQMNMNISAIIGQIKSERIQHARNADASSRSVDVERMIQMALAKYDADKTGEADFALESSGAWIMNTRCSESYELYSASYKLFGLTLWRTRNGPRVVIQSGVVPGECWCFKGSEGRLAIHLSTRVIPTAFAYEHIPVSLSRDGHIRSAPNRFIVYGLNSEDDLEPEILGEYQYLISAKNGDETTDEEEIRPLQRFMVQNIDAAKHTFNMIELAVKSNHGHPEYTCLYRFRVHGVHPNIVSNE